MVVYKFESGSVDISRCIQHVTKVLEQPESLPSILVVPALGSTHHTLEAISEAHYAGRKEDALQTFQTLFDWHAGQVHIISEKDKVVTLAHLDEFRTEVEWLLHDKPVRPFEYYYDQIVCAGVLMSSVILASALKVAGFKVLWTDIRDIIRTDDQFTHAQIDMSFTRQQVDRLIRPAMASAGILVTQGFIGSTDENESTTLGHDGIDLSASVLATCMGAAVRTI
jgi:aspartate kinase